MREHQLEGNLVFGETRLTNSSARDKNRMSKGDVLDLL
jgi:hypothetical protein